MKWIKRLILLVVIVVVLFVGAAVVLVATLDPNDYKDQIAAAVKDSTGRDLKLAGDIDLTFFPWLGMKLGSAQLSNAAGFGTKPFARVQQANVRVAVMPLLKGEVKADTLVLKGMVVNLHKKPDGSTNWDDLMASQGQTSQPGQQSSDDGGLPVKLAIGGINVDNAELHWQDEQAGTAYDIAPISLTTGELKPGQPFDLSARAKVNSEEPAMQATINLSSRVVADLDQRHYQLKGARLQVDANGEALPDNKLSATLDTSVDANMAKESVTIKPLALSLDDTTLKGQASIMQFARPRIRFALMADTIDADRYLPAPAEGTATHQKQAPAEEKSAAPADDRLNLPTETLRNLDVDGHVQVGKLKVSGLTLNDIKVDVTAKKGKLNVKPVTMSLYQGSYKGGVTVDVSGNTPHFAVSTDLQSIELGPLLQDLLGKDQAHLRGNSRLAFDLNTKGQRISTLKEQLAGTLTLAAKDGALQDKELAAQIEKVVALLKGRQPKAPGEEVVFDSLTGSADITNGIANNNDLVLLSPLVTAKGRGKVNIPDDSLDYQLELGLAGNEEGKRRIPLTVKGPFDDLDYGVDLKSALSAKEKQQIQEKKQQVEKKVQEEKEKIQNKLKKQFKDKFNF